jgi:nicotinamidase-related amidase
MTSQQPIRDPLQDHMLTPQNAALVIIDFQPTQVSSIQSRDRHQLVANIVKVAKIGKLFNLPIVLSTVNVGTGLNKPTISPITNVLAGVEAIDRTAINVWEDESFVAAVTATGRRKLVMAALWTEVCLVFPGLDALKEGFDVYPVVDAVAGTSAEAHEFGLKRLIGAGAKPTTWIQFACELQRDWSRKQTAAAFAETIFAP